jgi:hypothetical protein
MLHCPWDAGSHRDDRALNEGWPLSFLEKPSSLPRLSSDALSTTSGTGFRAASSAAHSSGARRT